LLTGAAGHWYFSDNVGLFAGADYTQRGFEYISGEVHKAGYLDATFGMSFRHGGWARSNAHTKLGAFYALPLGDIEDGETTLASTKPSFGLMLETFSAFSVSPGFSLGPVVSLKYGLSDAFEEATLKTFNDFGIALGGAAIF
jgi:hypothetical protein